MKNCELSYFFVKCHTSANILIKVMWQFGTYLAWPQLALEQKGPSSKQCYFPFSSSITMGITKAEVRKLEF